MANYSYHVTATATDGTRQYLARTEDGDALIWTPDSALAINYSHGRAHHMAKTVSYFEQAPRVRRATDPDLA